MPTTVRSFSKINLGLAIGPVRADGFHSLTTLYQTLAAHDLVTVEAQTATETRIRLTCSDERVPCDERNTAFKAVRLALETAGAAAEVAIHIEKRLPVQGGMGAGSANAAAALLALDRELKARGMTAVCGSERLRIAAEVGSDVPLFLIGGAVLGVGRGEEVYPMPDLPPTRCVVALPEIGVSTPQAFKNWDARHSICSPLKPDPGLSGPPSEGRPASTGHDSLTGPGPSGKLNTLSRLLASAYCEPHSSGVFASGADLAENPLLALVRTGIENDFEEVVFPQNPLFGTIKRALAASDDRDHAAIYAALSGSGSALFGLYATEVAADAAEERLAKIGIRSMRTETLTREKYWKQMASRADS
ncbi:MAG TPA: 4-(cytidine 5'-diphospho)-2-C-methyl-D-erythritol kinase [Acidobacteriaceae bacterium]|nr:4-(cytidine 5'-diphospho)-2-C-methyl-D-erythritol kinase [Acidobacteriaceae bacterium]